MLELWGILLSTFSKSWRHELNFDLKSEDFEQARCVYIGLLRAVFRLLSALWTPELVLFYLQSKCALYLLFVFFNFFSVCLPTSAGDIV